MDSIFFLFIQIISIITASVGGIFIIFYIFENFVFKNAKDINFKNDMFFLIEIDSLGEQLEYYIRNIQQELKTNKYFSTGKLILYSKSNYKIYEKKEITDLLNILSVEYENLIYMENNDIENIINKKTAG